MQFTKVLLERVEPVLRVFYDREKRELRSLCWGLVGLVMAIVGLSIFAMDAAAALEGATTVVVNKRRSTHMAIEVRALLMLFFGTAGVATVDNAVRLGYPAVYEHLAYRLLSRLIIVPLVLATFLLGGFVIYAHYIR